MVLKLTSSQQFASNFWSQGWLGHWILGLKEVHMPNEHWLGGCRSKSMDRYPAISGNSKVFVELKDPKQSCYGPLIVLLHVQNNLVMVHLSCGEVDPKGLSCGEVDRCWEDSDGCLQVWPHHLTWLHAWRTDKSSSVDSEVCNRTRKIEVKASKGMLLKKDDDERGTKENIIKAQVKAQWPNRPRLG